MKTRYTYLGESTIEIVIDGEEIAVNILPNVAPTGSLDATDDSAVEDVVGEEVQSPLPPESLMLQSAAPPSAKRGLKACIRGVWTFTFTVFGEGLSYLVQNLSGLDLPAGAGAAVGAGAAGLSYGIKKYVAPDTLI